MTTLTEIKAAAETLPLQEQKELLLFLATRLRASGELLPTSRNIPKERIDQWIATDEAGYRGFLGK